MEAEPKPLWEDHAVRRVLDAVLEPHLLSLAASMSASDIAEINEAYLGLFEVIFDGLDENWEEPFQAAVREAIDGVAAFGPGGPAQVLRDHRFLKETGELVRFITETTRSVVERKILLAPDIRGKLETARQRLEDLREAIESECPHLLDSLAPSKPALRLNNPKRTASRLANTILDCDFILGRKRIMSLELGALWRSVNEKR